MFDSKANSSHVLHVVGARPNFVKLAAVFTALKDRTIRQSIVHTGQHYDDDMSRIFFNQLGIPDPDFNLDVGSGSQAQQTSAIVSRFERVVIDARPALVMVYGDVNSTLAAALVCSKLLIPVAHVEAGLRSFDRTMPEEINRVLTDQMSSLLFTPSIDANRHLTKEGIPKAKVFLVGNVMIDTLKRLLPYVTADSTAELPEKYVLVTLHRPSNVDDTARLRQWLDTLEELSALLPVIFPVHPRTRQKILELGAHAHSATLQFCGPQPYLRFLWMEKNALCVITDSGGIQEETTFLGTPCLTVRDNTERPITIEMGTNVLVGLDRKRLKTEVEQIFIGFRKKGTIPPLWDGCAAERIASILSSQGL